MLSRILYPVVIWLCCCSIPALAQTDTTPPTVPGGLAAGAITVDGFRLSWSASTDNVGVTGYEVFRGTVSIGTVLAPALSFNFSGLAPNTTYTVKVRARDAVGKWSALSAALSVKTLADTTSPAVPAGLAASVVTATGLTLAWGAATDNVAVTAYEVFKDGVSLGTTAATALTKTLTGLAPTTAYALTVRARDAAGNWSPQSPALSVTTPPDTTVPSVPTGLLSSALTATGLALKWTAANDNVRVTGYEIFRDGVSLGVTTGLTKTLTALVPMTTYAFTVRARDAAGNWSAQSPVLSITTLPDTAAPSVPITLAPSNVTISSFLFRWNAATDNVAVNSYEVFRDGASIGLVAAPATSLSLTGLALSKTYAMTVRARDAAGNWSSPSAVRSVTTLADTTPPTVPAGLAASAITINSFTLSWSASTDNVGVTAYEIFRGNTSLGLVAAPALAFNLSGLAPNTGYSLRVRARDAAGKWSAQSVALVVRTLPDTTDPAVPTGLLASGVTVTGFTLSWGASTDDVAVTAYEVFRNGVSLGTTAALSKTLAGLTPDTAYVLTVRARDAAANWSDPSAPLTITTLPDTTAPAIPSGLNAVSVNVSSFTLKWSAATDDVRVTGYEVFKGGLSLGVTTSVSKNITGLTPAIAYAFTVRARDATGNWSAPSAALAVTTAPDTTPPAVPTGLVASALTSASFTLKWGVPTDNVHVTAYEIFKDGVSLGTTTTAAKTLTGLYPETEYVMTVRASDAAGNWSAQSLALPVTTLADTTAPSVPAGLVASAVTVTSFTLTWTAATDGIGVTLYEIFQDNVSIGTTAATTFALTGLTPNTTYLLKVRAGDAAGNWSAPSIAKSVKTAVDNVAPTVPVGLVASAISGTSFTLGWTAATDNVAVTAYEVFRGTVSLGTTDATAMVINGLTLGSTYAVKVRARDAKGNWSAQSATLSVTTYNDTTPPTTPAALAAADLALTGFTLTWTASTDDVAVTAYEIFKDGVFIGTSAISSFAVTGLALNGTSVMTVRARDANANWSALSAPLAVTTAADTVAPSVPQSVVSSNLTPAGFAVMWSASVDDVGIGAYEVFVNGVSQGLVAAGAPTFNVTALPPGGPAYVVTVRARDAAGNWSAPSEPVTVTLNPVPFFTGFEPAEGYLLGSLQGQNGWNVDGAAAVVTTPVYRGAQAVAVAPMASLSLVNRQFANTNPGVTFVDLFARPAAAETPDAGAFFETDVAAVAITRMEEGVGAIHFFGGNGTGGGEWLSAGAGLALDTAGQVTVWQRFTLRIDYAAKRWDLYLNGRLFAADLGFLENTSAAFTSLSLNGHAALTTGFDDVFVGFENPLFTDADKDGMDDAWELAHGLNPFVNDRNGDLDGDGVSNLIEYLNGSGPEIPNTATDTDGDGLPDAWEIQYLGTLSYGPGADPGAIGHTLLQSYQQSINPWPAAPFTTSGLRLWLRADAGVLTDPAANVSQWTDLSGGGYHAVPPDMTNRPKVSTGQMNGRPVIQFNGTNQYFALPHFMAGATAGEMFIVARLKDFSNTFNGLAHFGNGYANAYSDGVVWNDFGIADDQIHPGPGNIVLTGAHVLNATVSAEGESLLRFNGVETTRLTGQTVGFRSDPVLGADRFGDFFNGDIAEVIVFDHVLTDAERYRVTDYIAEEYFIPSLLRDKSPPSVPIELAVATIGSRTVVVKWHVSSDDRSLAGYRVFVNGFEFGRSIEPTFSFSGFQPNTAYNISVMAEDAAGNQSALSAPLAFTTLAAEFVEIPTEISATDLTPTGFTLSWRAGAATVASYDVYRNGILVGSTTGNSFTVAGLSSLSSFNLTVVAKTSRGDFSKPSAELKVPNATAIDLSYVSDTIPDRWKLRYGFDPTDVTVAESDFDLDGLSNLQEYQSGSSPLDYYNGVIPIVTWLGESGKVDPDNTMSLRVTSQTGVVMANAPVVITVRQGSHMLMANIMDSPAREVTIRTDSSGIARVFMQAATP